MARPKVYEQERVQLNVRSRTLRARLKGEADERRVSLSEHVAEKLRSGQETAAAPSPDASGGF
jgi:hypothetical protein